MVKNCFVRTDAHVHMGYYTRYGYEEPFYYSPRLMSRIMFGSDFPAYHIAEVGGFRRSIVRGWVLLLKQVWI